MSQELEMPSGVPGLGNMGWGSHYCHFYDTRDELVDTLVPFFKAGIEANNACLWVTSEPFSAIDARSALGAQVSDLNRREGSGQIEIIDHREWYSHRGQADATKTLEGWIAREQVALRDGYQGLRLTGNTSWVERSDFSRFMEYERVVNDGFRQRRIIGLCSYCSGHCSGRDVLDVINHHQFAISRQGEQWRVLETAALSLIRHDLVRLERMAEELRDSDRRKDEFIAILGHELRNPLSPITTAAQLMRLKGAQVSYEKELATIERQIGHLMRLIDDLLDLSRISQGKVELRREPTPVTDVMARSLEMATHWIEQRHHQVRVSVAPELLVDVDRDRFTQAVTNLVINAAKYTPNEGEIELSAERQSSGVQLRITDNGPGIEPALLPHVFELFVQGSRGLARGGGGLGLGLPIVKKLIELHGGTIRIAKSSPEGTTVAMWLPSPALRRDL